jgi:hypothetical protein
MAGITSLLLTGLAAQELPKIAAALPLISPRDYAETFQVALGALERAGATIVVADPVLGVIATEITVTGQLQQTGTRTILTFGPAFEHHPVLRVAVTEQKRFSAGRPEPWGDPRLNETLSREILYQVHRELMRPRDALAQN